MLTIVMRSYYFLRVRFDLASPYCRSNAIPKDIQIVLNSYEEKLYCMGLANSILESEWNTVYERLTTASWIQRGYLFKALTCSRNVTLLKRSVSTTAYLLGPVAVVQFRRFQKRKLLTWDYIVI